MSVTTLHLPGDRPAYFSCGKEIIPLDSPEGKVLQQRFGYGGALVPPDPLQPVSLGSVINHYEALIGAYRQLAQAACELRWCIVPTEHSKKCVKALDEALAAGKQWEDT